MSREVQPLGTFGKVAVRKSGTRYVATTRYRDQDGRYVRFQVTDATATKARNALKYKIALRSQDSGEGEIERTTKVSDLAKFWMHEARQQSKQAPQTLDAYERNLVTVVVPALGQLRLSEVTVGRVDRYLKKLGAEHPSRARRARVVLSLMFDLAVRHDAVAKNPVRDAAAVPKSQKEVRSLDQRELDAFRDAVAKYRKGDGVLGPKPDGQLADVIDTILGTSARIGEALAIRKGDVNMTVSPPTVTISGTLVFRKGMGLIRQPHPKHSKDWRIIAVPSFTAQAIRSRLAEIGHVADDHPVFATRNGTFIAPNNLRRQLRAVREQVDLPDVDLSAVTPHTFRKTVATAIDRAASSKLASELLGHSSPQITETYYIQPTKTVDPVTAEILEELGPSEQ